MFGVKGVFGGDVGGKSKLKGRPKEKENTGGCTLDGTIEASTGNHVQ